ncbi:MAG: hypothetical protein HQL69_00665 [Magnetococcales bacterium]|nr:hypothetical protein [Magnetococcales bacterium]
MKQSTPLPFFLVVDDGAFPKVHGHHGQPIPFSAYETILRLAEKFNMRIPICFTMGYLDLGRRCGDIEPLSYGTKLLKFIEKHEDRIEFAEHGLYHRFGNTTFEYFNDHSQEGLGEAEQKQKITTIKNIFKDLGREFPTLQVPPAHGWQPGVTDRLYAQVGVKDIVSYRFRKHILRPLDLVRPKRLLKALSSYAYIWPDSQHLNFFPRVSMGILANDINPHGGFLAAKVKRYILPGPYIFRRLLHRTPQPFAVHSYMTHIANFAGPDAFEFWAGLLSYVQNSDRLVLAHDHKEAKALYQALPDSLKLLSGSSPANVGLT